MNNNWISVKERLPESHMEVLVYGKHYLRKKHMIAVAEYDHKWSWWNQCGVSGFDTEWDMVPDSITHWMPLAVKAIKEILKHDKKN